VAKRLIGSGCRLRWWVGSVVVLDGVEIVEGEGQFWGKCGAYCCNQYRDFVA